MPSTSLKNTVLFEDFLFSNLLKTGTSLILSWFWKFLHSASICVQHLKELTISDYFFLFFSLTHKYHQHYKHKNSYLQPYKRALTKTNPDFEETIKKLFDVWSLQKGPWCSFITLLFFFGKTWCGVIKVILLVIVKTLKSEMNIWSFSKNFVIFDVSWA